MAVVISVIATMAFAMLTAGPVLDALAQDSAQADDPPQWSISADQTEAVKGVIARDAAITKAVSPDGYAIEEVLPWLDPSDTTAVVGGVATLTFKQPQHVEADFPEIGIAGADGKLSTGTWHVSATDVAALRVFVDLRTDAVIAVYTELTDSGKYDAANWVGTPPIFPKAD